jgi:hypothetical protein
VLVALRLGHDLTAEAPPVHTVRSRSDAHIHEIEIDRQREKEREGRTWGSRPY